MLDEITLPECLKKRTSLKRVTINSGEILCRVLTKEIAKNGGNQCAKLILIVNGGIIKGTPVDAEEYSIRDPVTFDENKNGTKVNLFSVGIARLESLKEYEKEIPDLDIIGDGSYLCLRDASLTIGQVTTVFPELIVFSDQIAGFALTLEEK